MRSAILSIALILTASPAAAQISPRPGLGDPHFQQVDYHDGEITQVRAAPGFELMVELSPDEQIKNVAVGDPRAWSVSASRDGNRLFLRPLEAGSSTNMTVVTSVRTYAFDLFALGAPSSDMPYTIQFHYPGKSDAGNDGGYVDVAAIKRRLSRYRISGDRLLRPSSVSNDGEHTYISWPKDAPIPAVYTRDSTGNERLLNGKMGVDDIYVVDGAPQRLIFRIDRSVATADRISPRKDS